MISVKFNQGNRDSVIVSGCENSEDAWYTAEAYLLDVTEYEQDGYYCTGLPSGDGYEQNENGEYEFPVKCYDNPPPFND